MRISELEPGTKYRQAPHPKHDIDTDSVYMVLDVGYAKEWFEIGQAASGASIKVDTFELVVWSGHQQGEAILVEE